MDTDATPAPAGRDGAEPPVPLRFELPSPQWVPADPERAGVANALFFAVRRTEGDEGGEAVPDSYTPSLSVSGGWRAPGTVLAEVADESLDLLRRQGLADVELVRRRAVESEHAPVIAQTLGMSATVDGRTWDVRQQQALFGYLDLSSRRLAVVLHTLTCSYAQEPELMDEWRSYVASIEVGVDPEAADSP